MHRFDGMRPLTRQDIHLGGLERDPIRTHQTIPSITAGFPIILSWPEKSRLHEKVFIDAARRAFSTSLGFEVDNPCDHPPMILAAKEYPDLEPAPLRQAAPLSQEDYEYSKLATRIPYLIVMPKYDPISSLTKDVTTFLAAFFALFSCKLSFSSFTARAPSVTPGHAVLWSIGIRHGDINDNNMMWDPKTEKPKLCDFDLSHLCEKLRRGVEEVGPNGLTGFSNTGTWIFIAEELLSLDAMDGLVTRVYRHEVEALMYNQVWIKRRY